MSKNQLTEMIRKKKNYNKLLFKITQYYLRHCDPPEKLIKELKKLEQQLGIPEAEFW